MKHLTFKDSVMADYVHFVCDRIPREFGASLYRTMSVLPGTTYKFPYKDVGIPVCVHGVDKMTRSAIFHIEALGHKKSVHVFLSRMKGPEVLFSEIQSKIDDAVNEIVKENSIDPETLREQFSPVVQFIKSRARKVHA